MTPANVRSFAIAQLRADGIQNPSEGQICDLLYGTLAGICDKFRLQLPGSEIIPTSAVSGATRDDVDKKR